MKPHIFQAWLSVFSLVCPCLADEVAFFESTKYNNGDYGRYVTQSFRSSEAIAPRLNFMKPFTNCDDGSYIFVAPRGDAASPTPYILDASGSLVWAPEPRYGQVYNFQVQQYRGQPYLTFWAGNDAVGGHGEGDYYMLDQHYKQYRKISGANKLGADLHSFTITPEGTAIASLYEVVAADLSSVKRGKDKGWVWDSLFQELDVETGEAIFQWRASEHVDFSDSYRKMNAATHNDPWDFFHINSIEKDAVGNYLVSSRHLRTILYVSGATGDVLWRLGGKSNDFTTFSGGSATSFVGQHDAHWVGNHTAITFFDNGADWAVDVEHGSKGLRVAIDLQNMTAQLNGTYKHPDTIISSSQGSYQTLPNENVLIGWGYNGALTEYAPNGTVLCDAYFEPSSRFKSGDVQSYRNLKFNWTAFPTSDPSLVLANETLYVSWNGATEVRSWLLQDSHTEKNGFDGVAEFTKTGFETDIVPAGNLQVRRYVRAVALDRDGRLLGISPVVSIENMGTVWYHEDEQEEEDENDTDQEDSVDEQGNSTAELEEEMEDVQILLALVCLAMLTGLLVACVSLGWPALKGWRMVPAEEEDGKGMVEADSSNGRLWERLRSKLPSAVTKRHDAAQQLLGPAHQDGGDDRSSDVELSDVD